MSHARLALLVAALSILLLPTRAAAQVKVTKRPAVIERKTFDPNNKPADLPPLTGDERAAAVSRFEIKAQLGFTPGTTKQDKESGRWTANIRTQQLEIILTLKVVIWLPDGAPEKYKTHEEGHRQILEDVYKTADKVAKRVGQTYIGRGGKGTGDSAQAAQQAALKGLMQAMADEYLAETEKRAERVNALYDELTAHGTKASPTEAEASKQAFEREAKEFAEAAKKPKAARK
jgi:hypothetical protein